MKLLVVEDDQAIANEVSKALINEGFVVETVGTGSDAVIYTRSIEPDMIILDLGLPDIDGTEVIRRLRRDKLDLPILVLTARDHLESKIDTLDMGADDYLAKPFEMGELLVRLRVLGRRIRQMDTSSICIGKVTLDTAARSLSVEGSDVVLSRREYMLLKALMENTGRIQTRDAIENQLYQWGDEISSNATEVHISNLRKKLPKGFIETIRGVGYVVRKSNA